jgi:hypothetical protein
MGLDFGYQAEHTSRAMLRSLLVSRAPLLAALILTSCAGERCSKKGSVELSTPKSTCSSGPGCQAQIIGISGASISNVNIPETLSAITSSPELSGITWSKDLSRYLVVSDDTGLKSDRTNHTPILFAMSSTGALDNLPIRIDGLAELNDAESICSGPPGTFFLTTSHSLNKHEKSIESRRMLLHLELVGRTLRVLGKVDLLQAVDNQSQSIPEMAGAPANGRVDIEALAYQEGRLLIGLKSPLSANGEASILALPYAVETLRVGRLDKGAVSLWKRVRLCVEDRVGHACEGISDMAWLKNGSLVLTANAPKGMPTDGGGALWLLRNANLSDSGATLLHHFDGMLPEAVALSADASSLVLLFDAHGGPQKWATWPIPD